MNVKDHMRITTHTLKHYRNLLSPAFATTLANGDNEKELIQGTDDEDNFSPERAMNWHFYRREDDHDFLQPFKGFFDVTYNPSSRSILTKRNNKFEELVQVHHLGSSRDSQEFFNLVGRLIHHVQDMSTPSHVVPVFHGPEFFKDFRWAKDTYEKFSQINLHKYLEPGGTKPPLLPEAICPCPVTQGFVEFYDRAAQNTLDFLKSNAAKFEMTMGTEPVMASCEIFWQPYDRHADPNQGKQNRGFGQYGPFEPYFGEDKTLRIDTVTCSIKFSSYEHIFTQFVKYAISDTLNCLLYVDQCCSRQHL